jgi:hypothetical protein
VTVAPREVIYVPVSSEPLYECVARFFAVLAFPDDIKAQVEFRNAWCREAILREARADDEFAYRLQPMRAAYFIMTDEKAKRAIAKGATQLGVRKKAALWSLVPFKEAELGRKIQSFEVNGKTFINNDMERRMLAQHRMGSKDGDTRNFGSRVVKGSRSVIHASVGYWEFVSKAVRELKGTPAESAAEQAAELVIQTDKNAFILMLERVEKWRLVAPRIAELDVRSDDLISFVVT